uniref:Response regulatory domain-containing protein n=1 Tax=Palpitomonas bilix TaxID=652834 RepID=A0A7S3CVT2_9EUKA|mmetsp:Transcript_1132/g.2454  ORF Transcript_1132/g.2454 Transcript_1132/m.2454 type:complete len:100 (+) Transcript_1132:434-733(+)
MGYRASRVNRGGVTDDATRRWRGANVVFTDIQMPGSIDGLLLSSLLRRMGLVCPILGTSARGDNNLRNDSSNAGMTQLLVKPVSARAVKEALLSVLPAV